MLPLVALLLLILVVLLLLLRALHAAEVRYKHIWISADISETIQRDSVRCGSPFSFRNFVSDSTGDELLKERYGELCSLKLVSIHLDQE